MSYGEDEAFTEEMFSKDLSLVGFELGVEGGCQTTGEERKWDGRR